MLAVGWLGRHQLVTEQVERACMRKNGYKPHPGQTEASSLSGKQLPFWFDGLIRKEYGREAADQFYRGARKLRNEKSWQHGKIKNCRKFDLVARLQIQFDPDTSGLSSNKWLTQLSDKSNPAV